MQRIYTKNATGVAPDGRWFAGDINALQDAVAAISDLTQAMGIGTLAVGESGLQLLRYGPGEARVTGMLRTDGIFRGLGGLVAGAFTTTQRNAIPAGSRPYGLVILNTTTNQLEWNAGTDAAPNFQPIGNTLSSGADVLANRPLATAVAAGSMFFATDQVVKFIAAGGAWVRESTPAGATVEWHAAAAVPAGWTAYDGGNLPASTGIYADLATHLGGVTKPDTRGRVSVAQGTHVDAATIGENEGLVVASRTPKHNSSLAGAPGIGSLAVGGAPGAGTLALPNHVHSDPGHAHQFNRVQAGTPSSSFYTSDPIGSTGGTSGLGDGPEHRDTFSVANATTGLGNPTSLPAVNGAPSIGSLAVTGAPAIGTLTAGPGGSRPTDSAAYIVCLKIAKL